MSVATEVAPAVGIPERAGAYAVAAPGRLASVAVLAPPDTDPFAAPVRLTRRGVLVLSLAVAVLCTSLAWLAGRSAPGPAAAPDVPATVIVAPGDTLWSIAARAAPRRDPRAEVADLQRRNHLADVDISPGQVLRLR